MFQQSRTFPHTEDIIVLTIKTLKTLVWHLSRQPQSEINHLIKPIIYDEKVRMKKAKGRRSSGVN